MKEIRVNSRRERKAAETVMAGLAVLGVTEEMIASFRETAEENIALRARLAEDEKRLKEIDRSSEEGRKPDKRAAAGIMEYTSPEPIMKD